MTATPRIFQLSSVVLDPACGWRRESTRPLDMRQPDFDARFDHDTLFYDVFRHPDDDRLVLVGPALNNLGPLIDEASFVALPSRERCAFRRFDLDRTVRVEVAAPAGTERLEITTAAGRFEVTPSPCQTELYRGLRVLWVVSKDNALDWICDWARFNRDVHGAEALVFYDNASSSYAPEDIADRLGAIEGLSMVGIVPVPFRFGPPGHGLRQVWDSNFLQIGAMEHARWRFLMDARSVLNTDVDELVVSRRGRSIFEAAETSGVVRFFGAWVPNVQPSGQDAGTPDVLRHKDFALVEPWRPRLGWPPLTNLCQPKWAIVPRRVPVGAQLTHHRVKRWWRSWFCSLDFAFRHFRGLSTSWKYKRDRPEQFDASLHSGDKALEAAYRRVSWDR